MTKILIWDTETTHKIPQQANLVQLAGMLEDFESGTIISQVDLLVRPDGWIIPEEATKIHGISQEMADEFGLELSNVCYVFYDLCRRADIIVAHNIQYDQIVMTKALADAELTPIPWEKRILRCTMKTGTRYVKSPPFRNGSYKWPTLTESMQHFYKRGVEKAHNALFDTDACRLIHHALYNEGAFN